MKLAALATLSALTAPAPAGAATAEVVPPTARPGDAVMLTVRGAEAEPKATVAGREVAFWRAGDAWRALASLPVEAAPGPAKAVVTAGRVALEATFAVVEPRFRSTTLSVPPRFVEPPPAARRRMKEDQKALAAAWETPFAPPLFRGAFGWPRRSETTGRFGDQRVYNGRKEGVHYGLDLTGRNGEPVAAANDGRVVLARDCYMSGRTVVIWHGAGLFTVYLHLSRMDVKPGGAVKKGQRIGLVGASGRATGPHLHWGVKVNGLYVDPESILRIDFERGTATPPTPAAAPAPAPPGPAAGQPPNATEPPVEEHAR